MLAGLATRYRGLRFCMIYEHNGTRLDTRPFVDIRPARDLAEPVDSTDDIYNLCAMRRARPHPGSGVP